MKDTRKYDKSRQLHKEGSLRENRVELEGNVEVHSISSMSEEGRNDVNEYDNGLLEQILSRDNMNKAYKRVKANKGSHGIDGLTVDELLHYLKEHGQELRQSLLESRYRPLAVRRVEIPKPDGGIRLLGIPTVLDRVIQQAISQTLIPVYEKKFSDNSYGFRPLRSGKQAVEKCRGYINAGHTWTVNIDLSKYFDTINHDKLIRILSEDIKDSRVISLIRKYLQSGVMINGVFMNTEEGAPQGGPLSPLLSNVMLHELDVELTKRGLNFCRYADDANIYVKSEKSANRVMKSITRFIEEKLKLRVNKEKSTVDRPWKLKFLGFSFYRAKGEYRMRVPQKPIIKFKAKLKELTSRSNAMSMKYRFMKLKQVIVGWINYFAIADIKSILKTLDEWLRRRIRMCFWKQWKKIKTKYGNLVKLGIPNNKALQYANTRKGYWRTSNSPILNKTLTNKYLKNIGLVSISETYLLKH
ncbi:MULTISPECIES: group II intron reverse transcriptase/maturase [unclassified Clostridium]|uniref:group II intron reverse transcriptase/maturase n=2 Tax=Clostridium TaxID=1485 RepID=UPI00215AEEDD|nr:MULTISPECIES: group II intron reverse transcriptase/maturase [unclassified Clostridium]UVE39853.1 group II intron reverse transcriptase/maturase [Clostridium sp. CM027]UVE39925.1 group II intron reverse transcriptase/maturase [Clostridium sp. CM027]UVE39927.1 group II intron reverse transcriptase/maturase [Clostridium sp. CM027]UVE39929.1 group II intron reverse transcriptase/maturase [Clostridium sp. CM027]UVE39975.1 group II intron reverse transcriptase/maturase [Clostridium sp. CM027]